MNEKAPDTAEKGGLKTSELDSGIGSSGENLHQELTDLSAENEPILFSLASFREIILEAFRIAGVRRILEIGSQYGMSTEKLCAYAESVVGQLITVDPAPQAAAREFIEARSGRSGFRFIQSTSLEVLPTLPDIDAYIIDGDHNYYTVRNELEEISRIRGNAPWLVFEHDVCWPSARRDFYYAPERIPAEHRQPYATSGGVTLDSPGIVPGGLGDKIPWGIALREGGPRNGVRTAIEDFLAGHLELRFDVIPAIFGLGVIYSREAPWAEQLETFLKPWANNPLLERMEENRLRLSLWMLRQLHLEESRTTVCRPETLPGRHKLELFRASSRAVFNDLWSLRFEHLVREQDSLFNPTGTAETFKLGGLCAVCGGDRDFITDFMFASPGAQGNLVPAWRERQVCVCGLNCRQRSCLQILTQALALDANSTVYCTEQATTMFQHVRRLFPRAIGSEALGRQIPLGAVHSAGWRNEDLSQLTFADASLDCIFSPDVLGHVPDYRAALREMARCLKPGGTLLLTVPLHFGQDKTVTRASFKPDGTLMHHLSPIHHGSPVHPQGVLCFHDFGWDLLAEIRAAGLPDATLFVFSAPHYGYVGLQYVILASRPTAVNGRETNSEFRWPVANPAARFQSSSLPSTETILGRQPVPANAWNETTATSDEEDLWHVEGRTYAT